MKKRHLILLIMVVSMFMISLAEEPKVTVICGDSQLQFELISPEGTRVFTDVSSPDALSKPAGSNDILLTTNSYPGTYLPDFVNSFPGKQLFRKIGTLEGNGVKVTGISSMHDQLSELLPENGANYIFLIEMGGLRIADFGYIGQEKLTKEQLDILGEIDIAITQLKNPFCNMTLENRKGFNLMDQLNPKLIIPTNFDEATARFAVTKWEGFYAVGPVKIGKSDLVSPKPRILFMESWGKICKGLKLAKKWNK